MKFTLTVVEERKGLEQPRYVVEEVRLVAIPTLSLPAQRNPCF